MNTKRSLEEFVEKAKELLPKALEGFVKVGMPPPGQEFSQDAVYVFGKIETQKQQMLLAQYTDELIFARIPKVQELVNIIK